MATEIRIRIHRISPSASEAAIREHRVPIGRPAAKGGDDAGPMGGELFLASIGGCFMSNLLAAIRTREANVSGVQVEVVGSLADAPARFTGIELQVTIESDDQALAEKLVEIADRGCIMMNTLRGMFEMKVSIQTAINPG